jgi:tetratricopeptide (TPR) repeat protein
MEPEAPAPWAPPPAPAWQAPAPAPAAWPPQPAARDAELDRLLSEDLGAPRRAEDATQVSPPPEPPAAPPSPGSLDFGELFVGGAESAPSRQVEAVFYTVRAPDGAEYGPYDQVTMRAYLQTQRLLGNEEASVDGGRTWRPLAMYPEFTDLLPGAAARANVPTDLARVEISPARRARDVVQADHGLAGQRAAPIDQARPFSIDESRPHGIDAQPAWAPAHPGGPEPEFAPHIAPAHPVSQPPPSASALPPSPSLPRPAERPAWLAPAVTAAGGRAYVEARRGLKRKRVALIAAVGVAACGGAAFLLLYEPGFEGEEAIRKKISLDEAQIRRYSAQAREQMHIGTYRAYAESRTKLASVLRAVPTDRLSKSIYLQALLYLMREYGQAAISGEAEKVKRELDRAGERGLEFQKAKAGYALWKGDHVEAGRFLERVLQLQPDDKEAMYLHGVALTTPKDAPQAVKLFDKLVAADPRNGKVRRARAEALLLVDRKAGITALREIVQHIPANASASLKLAEIYYDDGRREDAKRLFLWVVDPRAPAYREAAPDELARAYAYLGRMSFEDQEMETARKYLEASLRSASSPTERVRALLALGEVLIALREFKGAITQLELAKEKLPTSPDVLSRLAVAYVRDGQTARARQAVVDGLKVLRARAVEDLPPREREKRWLEEARMRLASATVNEGDEIPRLGEAVDDFKAAVELAEKAASAEAKKLVLQARVQHAALLRRQKNLNGALALLQEALKLDANSAVAHNGLGEVYAEQGQAERAEAALRKALSLDGRLVKARFNLASLLSEQGKVGESLKEFDAIAKVDPKFPGLNLAMAIAYQRQKRYTEAIDAFERAVKASPDDPRVFLRIGIAYFELGGEENLDKARNYLDRAIEKNRQLNEAYYYRGRVLLALGKPESAIDDFKLACEREPDNGVYRIYWGWAFEKAGSMRDSVFQYNRAIELLREQRNEVDIALALYRRGRLRLERDEIAPALQDLEEALKYDAANTEVLVLLGDSLAQAKQHRKAVARYRAAIARGKSIKGLWFKMGRSLLEIHQRPEATRAFLSAAAEDPSDCYPHYYLGYLYKDGKQEAQAVRSLRKFLSLCKSPPEAKDVNRDIYDMEVRLGVRRPQ